MIEQEQNDEAQARMKDEWIAEYLSKTDECRDFSEYLDTVKRVEKLILENETIGF